MKIDEIRLEEDSKRMQKAVQQSQQGHWTSWESALQRSLTWNEIWHMASLRISFLIRAVYNLLTSNAIYLVRWRIKNDPTCSLRQGKQHALSSCNVALSQGRYAWRYNRVLQELALVICYAKRLFIQFKASALVFTSEGGKKSLCGSVASMDTE
ncbi:polyprotein [Plakobranchus ocellatus]|uniref:Polyprotein n=1 Tax=Plakobranchus ocellatus TaxID=259542 RepID=A0AAV4BE83_9GAST|nr:polyprotein [Plakobranchus ocellatus]